MSFNTDSSKQAQEVVFSRKIKKPNHPELIFNNIPVNQTSYQKHLGMFLDNKLNFGEHLKYITNKVNKSIGLLRKLQMSLPRRSLVTICKSFIRPHLGYGDIIFDQAFNKSFHDNYLILCRIYLIQCFVGINWCNMRYFERKALSGIRFRISPTKAFVSQTVHLLQDI